MKKLSVVIPAYNESRDIENCLQSLLNQDHPNYELIVVDDGSHDSTQEIVKKYPVKLIIQDHLGAGPARNFGSKQSGGDILVFVDADMTFSPDFLSKLVKPIQDKKTVGTFSIDEFVANPENIWSQCWNINKNLPTDKMIPSNSPDHQPVFRAILKSEFEKVGGFEPTGYDDDWTLSKKLGVQASLAPGAVFYHRNPDNLGEVWTQAQWAGKRKFKLGLLGKAGTHSLPYSLLIGMYKAIKFKKPEFLFFKIFYDLAVFTSLFSFKKYK